MKARAAEPHVGEHRPDARTEGQGDGAKGHDFIIDSTGWARFSRGPGAGWRTLHFRAVPSLLTPQRTGTAQRLGRLCYHGRMSRPWRLRNLALPALALAVVCVSAPATPAAVGGRTVKTLTPMTLYVDQRSRNCSDGGPGTTAQPFCRIGPASARVIAGQTVRVSPGTYRETVTVSRSGAPSAPIKFLAGRGGVVSVLGFPGGGASGFHVTGRSYLTIQGFSVKGTGADGIVIKNSAAIVVRGNHVSYAGQPAAGKIATGIRLEGVSASVVAGNTVDHNTNYGIYLQSGTRTEPNRRKPGLPEHAGHREGGGRNPAVVFACEHGFGKYLARQRGLRDWNPEWFEQHSHLRQRGL